MDINCGYYLGEGKCLIGECYLSQMILKNSQEIIDEHLKKCVSKNAVTVLLKNNPRKLESIIKA